MLAKIIDWSGKKPFPRTAGDFVRHCWQRLCCAQNPLDALPDLSDVQVIVYTEYPGRPAGRRSGHVSADHVHVVSTQVQGGAGLLLLWRLVRLHHLRGRYRHLLGTLARARIPQLCGGAHAQRRDTTDRPGCDGRGLESTSTRCWPRTRPWPNYARCRTGICAISSPRHTA